MKKAMSVILSLILAVTGTVGAYAANQGIAGPSNAESGAMEWDLVKFGSFRQSANIITNRIKWRILSVNGNDAFILADTVLDCMPYNETYESTTWEKSDVRRFLNNTFYNEAFSAEEKAAIKTTTVLNSDNPYYGTPGGNTTQDRVYLLSIWDASNEDYGFISGKARYAKPSNAAILNGCYTYRSEAGAANFGNCDWWLRTPGSTSNDASYVKYVGWDYYYGAYVYAGDKGVRPCMHINLSSDAVTAAGEVDSDGNVTEVNDGYNNPTVSDDDVVTWDCVYLGGYGQNTTYNVEDIVWRVLSVDGNDAMLMTDKAISCIPYGSGGKVYWEGSQLREWLNDEFLNTAFKADEKVAMIKTDISGTGGETGDGDYVYVLSQEEASDGQYGFGSDHTQTDYSKYTKPTDYARVNGCYVYSFDRSKQFYGNCYWWLRSQSYQENAQDVVYSAAVVDYDGWIDESMLVYDGFCGVRPVIHVDLSLINLPPAGKVQADLDEGGDQSTGDESSNGQTGLTPSDETGETGDGEQGDELPEATITASKNSVKHGKKTGITIVTNSGSKMTIKGKNKKASNKKYVKINNKRLSRQITFKKKAKKGKYRFTVTTKANENYKATEVTITIKVR